MRVALVQQGTPTFLDKEEDAELAVKPENFLSGNYSTNASHTFNGRAWIGIEHVNKAPKRSRYSTLEKAIKIYN
jgi:ubiquitin carboxyl-terminal hydrolase 7